MESEAKACYKITNKATGKVIYTRDPAILYDHRAYSFEKYTFEFISRTPKAIEILYLEQEREI